MIIYPFFAAHFGKKNLNPTFICERVILQYLSCLHRFYTGYFTSDNDPGGIENATHNTSGGKAEYLSPPCPGLRFNVLWVAFSIPPDSLSLMN
jgi:hypothetical protein